MNLNTRSATLQLISSVNFINHAENNPFAAAKAFANQPQYWKDFMTIMNSDMLKQRRDGLRINVTEAELAAAVHGKGNKAKKAIAWILKQGYIPTKIADSFAISSGGATYYRNRAKMYQKQGLSLKEAEAKAFIDFQAIAERTQQSSRPDLLSQQQTSFEGRLLLPFANTPMQMNRIMMKEM
jgi:DNA-binding CsgD family transcriptional regulator